MDCEDDLIHLSALLASRVQFTVHVQLFNKSYNGYVNPQLANSGAKQLTYYQLMEFNILELFRSKTGSNDLFRHNICLLIEWEGRTGKYLPRGHGVPHDQAPNIFRSALPLSQ